MGVFKSKKDERGPFASSCYRHDEDEFGVLLPALVEEEGTTAGRKKMFPTFLRRKKRETGHDHRQQQHHQQHHQHQQQHQQQHHKGQQLQFQDQQQRQQREDLQSSTEIIPKPKNEEEGQEEENEEEDLGDVPRSISTPSRDAGDPLPPLPTTPTDEDDDDERWVKRWASERRSQRRLEEESDSIGSPCESMLRAQGKSREKERRQAQEGAERGRRREEAVAVAVAEQQEEQEMTLTPFSDPFGGEATTTIDAAAERRPIVVVPPTPVAAAPISPLSLPPSLDRLSHYVAALSSSPDTFSDDPAMALRCLFSLSESTGSSSSSSNARVDMVRSRHSVVPALLSFLRRCPRDSSEQYLALLVLNNLSIPRQNKRIVALECDGAKVLGRLLCEDPGCHLLAIVIVNLTFGDEELNRDLLTMGQGGKVQLVDCLGYALLLSSLTAEQLAAIGPIPLASPEGVPHAPRRLLSLLFSLLEVKLNIRYRDIGGGGKTTAAATTQDDGGRAMSPLFFGGDDSDRPFPETARWCLGALKNLSRPGKLAPSAFVGDSERIAAPSVNDEEIELLGTLAHNGDTSAVAAHAMLDAGIMPVLLRVLGSGGGAPSSARCSPNSPFDQALYALMHVTSVPQVRRAMREDYGCVGVLTNIVVRGKESIGDMLLRSKDDEEVESLRQLSLQCLKARIALSYLVLSSETPRNGEDCGSATTLAVHEVHSLVELLSHCLQGRGKDGVGGYSAATFTLKGVLYGIKCILSERKNREVFAMSTGCNARRLNALLLKAVARFALLDEKRDTMDAEAAEHAVVSIYRMSLYGLDEELIEFACPFGRAAFLPAAFGSGTKLDGKEMLAKVLISYLAKDGISARGRHSANQILLRADYLKFAGTVADLTYAGKQFPSKPDFDFDAKSLAAIMNVPGNEMRRKGAKPTQYIFDRAISRRKKSESRADAKIFSSALEAAEELALNIPSAQCPSELDVISLASDIAYYADGVDMFYGHTWEWNDGRGDLIERIYSAAETEAHVVNGAESSVHYSLPRKMSHAIQSCEGIFGRLKSHLDENEPFTIFGLRCSAPGCGRGSVL